jgi:hypothetical protein
MKKEKKVLIRIRYQDDSGRITDANFDGNPDGAIEFLQGVPRASDAAERNAQIVAANLATFKQMELFKTSLQKNFR